MSDIFNSTLFSLNLSLSPIINLRLDFGNLRGSKKISKCQLEMSYRMSRHSVHLIVQKDMALVLKFIRGRTDEARGISYTSIAYAYSLVCMSV